MFVASLEKISISNYPAADLQPYGCFIIHWPLPFYDEKIGLAHLTDYSGTKKNL